MKTKSYVIDKVDDRDFNVLQLLWTEKIQQDCLHSKYRIFLKDNEIQNQSLDISTKYGCVFYTGSTICNTLNFLHKEKERISGIELCNEAEKMGLLDRQKWAWLISSPKLLKRLWYIESYARARTLDDVKLSLANNKLVQTGSNRINRKETIKNNNVVVEWESYWHSFAICWYDDIKKILICENSYGEEKFDDGYFYLKYEDFGLLFESRYVMTDKINNIPHNRYWKFLKEHMKNGYTPIFEDYSEENTLNAWEVKALIDLGYIKKCMSKNT